MTPPPDRAELERLDRDTLIARAEAAGVSRANILTRPELIDELLVRNAKEDDPRVTRACGFFGRARDLLARVIEQGLHLPDAAERLRRFVAPPPSRRTAPAAVPTVTLAEIYAAQGHRGRAIDTLKHVLEHEPDHAAARALLKQLSEQAVSTDPRSERDGGAPSSLSGDAQSVARSPAQTAASDVPPEPAGFLDDDPLPWRYDVDECVAISVDPTTIFAYWEIRETTLAHVRRSRQGGVVALRVLVITPSWEGPRSATTDVDVGEPIGDWFIRALPAGSIVRVAIGWRQGDVFLPIAHSAAIETPPDAPSPMMAEAFFAWSPAGVLRIDPASERAFAGGGMRDGMGARRAGAGASASSDGRTDGVAGGGHVDDTAEPFGSSEHAYA